MECFVPVCITVSTLICCAASVVGGLIAYGKHDQNEREKARRAHHTEGHAAVYLKRRKAGEVSFGVGHDQQQIAIERAARIRMRPDGLYHGINFRSERVSDCSHVAVRSGKHHPCHPYRYDPYGYPEEEGR